MAKKRALDAAANDIDENIKKSRPSSQILGISRSISACQRCRVKKIRCDQNFPKCSKCDKAGVECIGLDPATGREVPRSYVIHLEDRINALELKLKQNGIDPDNDSILDTSSSSSSHPSTISINPPLHHPHSNYSVKHPIKQEHHDPPSLNHDVEYEGKEHTQLLDEVKFNSINSKHYRSISTTQSISFAKLMSTAVRFQHKKSITPHPDIDNDPNHLEDPENSSIPSTTTGISSTKPVTAGTTIPLALLPPKQTAEEFIKIFFAQSNPQLPILHREEFLKKFFAPIYGKLHSNISLASNYTAINNQLIDDIDDHDTWFYQYKQQFNNELNKLKNKHETIDAIKISQNIIPPLKYHKPLYFLNIVFAVASSVHHLQYPLTISESFKLSAMKYIDQVYSSTDQLESLQGILLLSLYSIMRPNVPGCWYIVGSALRLCIDLGLHNESINQKSTFDSFTIDKRRRLFWCSYSLDRQICFYLSRPVGIPDESITTPFPSELDDALIIPNDINNPDYSKANSGMSSYKSVSILFFKIRKIQSEVQKILFENYELPRKYQNLAEWKSAMIKLLKSWKNSSPKTRRKMNCDFNVDFFLLNYNHTLLVLHGLSPKNFKLSKLDFVKVSESSKELINIYSSLLSSKSINYTWAAILNLFMAGTSYLYSIYNSESVRINNSLFEVKKITQECINVMNSLVDRCEAASNCKNTFEMLSAAVVKLKYNETVQGNIRIPSTYQISKTTVINNNLKNLVENLKQQPNQITDPDKLESLNPFLSSLNQYLIIPNEPLLDSTPSLEYQDPQDPQDLIYDLPLDGNEPTINNNMTNNNNPNNSNNPDGTISNNGGSNINNNNSAPMVNHLGSTGNFNSPSTFEWINNNDNSHDDTNNNNNYQDELNNFFDELAKSPNSTNSRRNSFTDDFMNYPPNSGTSNNYNNGNGFIQSNTTFMNGTPYSYDSNESSNSSPLLNINNGYRDNSNQKKHYQDQHNQHHHEQDQSMSQSSSQAGQTTSNDTPNDRMTSEIPSKDGRKVYELIHQVPIDSIWDQFFTSNGMGFDN